MDTRITQKLAALGMALMMSGATAGGMAYLVGAQMACLQCLSLGIV